MEKGKGRRKGEGKGDTGKGGCVMAMELDVPCL